MAEKKRILIVGGGYGGVWAGKILEKRFRRRPDVEITLVDRQPYHTLMTELHEVAGWRTEPDAVQVSFRKIFGAKRITVAADNIEKIDFEAKAATSAHNRYPFDHIVLGTGAEPEYFGTPGVEENSFTLWSFEDAMKIRRHLEDCFAAAAMETDADRRRRLLTFVVAGAGFTGMEMIGELLEYRNVMCRKHHLDRAECRVVVVEMLPNILPILEEPLRVKAETYLKKHGCEMMIGTPIVGAEKGKVLLKDQPALETETFIWTCGVRGSAFAGSLAVPLGKRNRLEADVEMKSTKYPFVYIVGDSSGFMQEGKPLAQIVETAHFTADAAARNIIADIDGGERHVFKPNYHGFMISLGSHYGVSNAGGMKTSGFFAIAIKHFINMYYLFNIAGLNQVWEYFKHEFLDLKVEEHRSIVGSLFAYKVRGYWPLLLRMWLGFMWFVESMNKIKEGWLNFSTGQSQSGWMFSKGVIQAGVKPLADAASQASAAVSAAPAATSAASAAASAAPAAVSAATAAAPAATSAASAAASAAPATVSAATAAAPAATSAASAAASAAPAAAHSAFFLDTSSPIIDPNSGFVTWFRHVFMDGIFAHIPYNVMQIMVVLMEMLIGLALFGGFFTWWAAAASIAMCLLFTFSGMFMWSQAWFFFAAILMLGGAGRAFGLDCWSVPFFKRWWNGTRLARKWHFYGDDPAK
jgi:NADH dehydrogenase